MSYGEGWNELEYLAEALSGRVDEIDKRVLYLVEWTRGIDEDERQEAAAAGHGAPDPEFPAAATTSLQEYKLMRAREADRLEQRDTGLQDAGCEPAELDDARRLLAGMAERVRFLETALKQLEMATDWVDSFHRGSARSSVFVEYRALVADTLHDFAARISDVSREGGSLVTRVKLGHREALKREAQQRQAEEADAVQASLRQKEAAVAAAQLQAAEKARRAADEARTPHQLAELLEGRWMVAGVNQFGQVSNQDVLIRRPHLGKPRYQSTAIGSGWRCDAEWEALNGRQIRILGTQTGPLGFPSVVPMEDLLTFNVYDRNRLHAVTTQGIGMDWVRR